jgi:PHD-finger
LPCSFYTRLHVNRICSDGEEEESQCASCGEQGDLVKCEDCNQEFHPACANPPLRCVPRGTWKCQDCRDAATKKKSTFLHHQLNKMLIDSSFLATSRKKQHGAAVMAQKSVTSRRSARDATNKISKAAKRLRSSSWDGMDQPKNKISKQAQRSKRRR